MACVLVSSLSPLCSPPNKAAYIAHAILPSSDWASIAQLSLPGVAGAPISLASRALGDCRQRQYRVPLKLHLSDLTSE
jgi:hypothetical protein